MILGLDISTSCSGWAVMDENGELVEHGYISLKKVENLLDKAEQVRYKIEELASRYQIDRIGIECILQKTSVGSAYTITLLAAFNGIVRYICYRNLKIIPELVRFSEARKYFDIKKSMKEKEKVVAYHFIQNTYKNFTTEYNRNNKVRSETMDSSDAVLIAKYLSCVKDTHEKSGNTKKKTRRVQKTK